MYYLRSYSAGGASYYGFSLPHCFSYDETKSFTQRFLYYYPGATLQGVYFHMTCGRKVEDMNVGVTVCGFVHLLQDSSPFRIVGSPASCQHKLCILALLH